MSDAKPPTSKIVFDKTIQVGTLLSMFTIAVAGIAGGFGVYLSVQNDLAALRMSDSTTNAKIELVIVDIRVLKENLIEVKANQKETDNALRKSLDTISDDLYKLRISLAERKRTGWLFPFSDSCWPDTGPIPTGTASTYPTDYN